MTESDAKANSKWSESANQLKESAEKVAKALPDYTLGLFVKRPRLILVKGLGRTQRKQYDVEGNTVILKDKVWKRGQKRESATFTVGSIITLGWWVFTRPYLFLKKGASRCIDFQNDLDAPGFSKEEAEAVFKGGLMEWWKSYKGTKQGNLLLLLAGGSLGVGILILLTMWGAIG